MNIAILGTRGVPAKYGGFETCAQEVGVGLVKKGHNVSVYCRKGNSELLEFKGVKLKTFPRIKGKYFDTFGTIFLQVLYVLFTKNKFLIVFGLTGTPFFLFLKIFGKKVVVNVDGLEWNRKKFSFFAKIYLKFCAKLIKYTSNIVITDSKEIQKYYKKKFKCSSLYIPYGAYIKTESTHPEILFEYGLKKEEYFLMASRLEPENNADITLAAYNKIKTQKKLVIVGDANWDSPFVKKLKSTQNPNVKFLGGIYKPYHLEELAINSYAYIHGNEVGGTNPGLLMALGYGCCVFALDVPFNREVAMDSALFYKKDPSDLAYKMELILNDENLRQSLKKNAVLRIKGTYTWDRVIDAYEKVLLSLVKDH